MYCECDAMPPPPHHSIHKEDQYNVLQHTPPPLTTPTACTNQYSSLGGGQAPGKEGGSVAGPLHKNTTAPGAMATLAGAPAAKDGSLQGKWCGAINSRIWPHSVWGALIELLFWVGHWVKPLADSSPCSGDAQTRLDPLGRNRWREWVYGQLVSRWRGTWCM